MSNSSRLFSSVSLSLALLFFGPQVFAVETAYEAMRVVGTVKGETSLAHVIEVRGTEGSPQPVVWKILTRNAKGSGLQEYMVKGNKIASERAIKDGPAMAAIDLNKLNLDSDGANTLVEREAKAKGISYDQLDYTLHGSQRDSAPVWEIRLVDQRSGKAASFIISADTGAVINAPASNVASVPPIPAPNVPPQPAPAAVPPNPVPGSEVPPVPPEQGTVVEHGEEEHERNGAGEELKDRVDYFFRRVGRHMDRRMHQLGDKLHNTFTGDDRDTVPPKDGSHQNHPEPAPNQRPQTGERPRD
jgi:hypothetical protein